MEAKLSGESDVLFPWTQRKTNEDVIGQLGVERKLLSDRQDKATKKYFGHVLKRHNCIQKSLFEGRVEGKRARGRRQRRKWEENNIKQWTNRSL